MTILSKTFRDLVAGLQDPRCDIFLKIYDDHKDIFEAAAGSGHNHQAWAGGYADHLAECLRVNEITYEALSQVRPLGFTKSSAAICLFLHDIEKPFRYGPADDPRCAPWQARFNGKPYPTWEDAKWEIIDHLQKIYGFVLSDDEVNAIKYTHGEGSDHRKDMRVARPLAAHVHHCDNTSARVWPEDGRGLGFRAAGLRP